MTSGGYSASLGPGARSISRPQPANGRQRSNTSRARPATAMGHRAPVEDDQEVGKQQNCMKGTSQSFPPPSHMRHGSMQGKAPRYAPLAPALNSQGPRPSNRQESLGSLVGEFEELSIDNKRANGQQPRGSQVNSVTGSRSSGHPRQYGAAPKHNITLRAARRDEVGRQIDCRSTESRAGLEGPPKTPPRAQAGPEMLATLHTTVMSALQTPRSPSKLTPAKQPFLTKDSNLTGYTAWDMDERLNNVESQFKVMKEAMDVSLTDRKTLEDAVAVAKTRGA